MMLYRYKKIYISIPFLLFYFKQHFKIIIVRPRKYFMIEYKNVAFLVLNKKGQKTMKKLYILYVQRFNAKYIYVRRYAFTFSFYFNLVRCTLQIVAEPSSFYSYEFYFSLCRFPSTYQSIPFTVSRQWLFPFKLRDFTSSKNVK